MDKRYLKNFPALGAGEQRLLKGKKVFIAGLGGLGGYLLEYMLRLGVGSVTVCDPDFFDESNLNRQLLSCCGNLGESKASAAEKRAHAVNPELDFCAYREFIGPDNADWLIKGSDVVLDGLDSVQSRKILFSACSRAGIPYIYGAVSGFTAQAAVLLPGSTMLDELYPAGSFSQPSAVLSFTPGLAAAMQASLCIGLLCGRELSGDRLYCADLMNMDFQDFSFI